MNVQWNKISKTPKVAFSGGTTCKILRLDELESIKESVITGRLIPAGTGFFIRNLKKVEQDLVE